MFERFTDDARRVVVLAQEEARLLHHNHIGTEHLLLGLLREGDGVAAGALTSSGVTLEAARAEVAALVEPGEPAASESVPFTDRAKTVLDLSRREARRLRADRIGPQHLLLGIIRERQGVAAQAIARLGIDLSDLRQRVTQQRIVQERLVQEGLVQERGALAPGREGSMHFAEAGEDPGAFARRVGIDPNLRVVLDHATANAVVYVLEGLEQMFRLDPPTPAQMRHFPEPFEGFSRTVLEGALEEMHRQLPPPSPT